MGWMVLLTLLLCMAASAVSVYPGSRARTAARRLFAAAACGMAATGAASLAGRGGAFADLMAVPAGMIWRAVLAVGLCAGAGVCLSALVNRFRGRKRKAE